MKKLSQSLFVTSLCLMASTSYAAKPKVVYGADNRVFVEDSNNEIYQKLAASTAVQIKNEKLELVKEGEVYNVDQTKLSESFGVCEDEEFAGEINVGNCSGFLVGEDLLVTAGHCIPSQEACDGAKWAFNYQKGVLSANANQLPASDVYSCTKIINQKLSDMSKNDFALIQLDRKVEGREPLKFRTEGKVAMGEELVVIGHPSGLPTVVADGAYVRSNDNDFYFQANLDTFGGNSGSAVFNATTGEVEGILVRGEKDYIMDEEAGCYRVYQCEDDSCRGEDVTRITNIEELAPGMAPEEPQVSNQQYYIFVLVTYYGQSEESLQQNTEEELYRMILFYQMFYGS